MDGSHAPEPNGGIPKWAEGGEFDESTQQWMTAGQVDPVALGRRVGNIINGLPEYPSSDDLEAARQAARFGVLDVLADFDETANPEEVEWGIPPRN